MNWPIADDVLVLIDSLGSDKFYREPVQPRMRYAAIENTNVWLKLYSMRDDDQLTARECYRNLFKCATPADWEYFVTSSQEHVIATSSTIIQGQFVRVFWDLS
jgi:hypothetical protein